MADLVNTRNQDSVAVRTRLKASPAKIGFLDIAIKCSQEKFVSLKMVIAEHANFASARVAWAKK